MNAYQIEVQCASCDTKYDTAQVILDRDTGNLILRVECRICGSPFHTRVDLLSLMGDVKQGSHHQLLRH